MVTTTWTPELTAKMRVFRMRLTRAQNQRDWKKVIAVVEDTRTFFYGRDLPLPDNWALFDNAREEAVFELRRETYLGRH